MTVIAWDGRMLAADRQATVGSLKRSATKIFRLPDGLVALSGDGSHAHALLAWCRGVRDPREFPRGDHPDTSGHLTVFAPDGVRVYDGMGRGYPEPIPDEFIAMGSGRDFAMAAMHLGCDARRAVEVACTFDVYCGMGIDVLQLDDEAEQ
jgi:ATP-dependent protease HslVU (ClpYQ) peptidase subunit